MFWADKIAQAIKQKRPENLQWVDDMKTPSGKIHVGSLLGVLLHDFIYKSLLDLGVNAKYTYVFNDMDPMDGMPVYLDESVYRQHMGKPLYKIPAPDGVSESFGYQYAHEFLVAMQKLGAYPEILWSHELYDSGKMNDVIVKALDEVEIIRKIYLEVAGQQKPENWYPFQVICPQCGKLGTTVVTDWDGEKVTFDCLPHLVKWAQGCGYHGKISPLNGSGKLMWKVDWPAHWKAIGITVEGAGKDHSSAGGSRDMAKQIMNKVFNYSEPWNIPYEFFLIGGRKMSSSKGKGVPASEFVEIFPPEIGRFLFARNHYNKQTNFTPEGMTIPDLFDEYDRCAYVYWEKGNSDDFGRFYEVAQVKNKNAEFRIKSWQEKKFVPRFLEVAKVLQDPKQNVEEYFMSQKGTQLTDEEKQILTERKQYAQIWLKDYAPEDVVIRVKEDEIPEEVASLSEVQKKLLKKVADFLKENLPEDEVQNFVYQTGKNLGLKPKESFEAVYLSLLGKTHGPKAGALICSQEIEWVKKRFSEVQKIKK